MLRKLSESDDEWDSPLDPALLAYRTTTRDSAGFTPFKLEFGKGTYLPIEARAGGLFQDNEECSYPHTTHKTSYPSHCHSQIIDYPLQKLSHFYSPRAVICHGAQYWMVSCCATCCDIAINDQGREFVIKSVTGSSSAVELKSVWQAHTTPKQN